MEGRVDVVASKEIVLRLKQKYPRIDTRIPLQELLSKFEIIRVSSDIQASRDPDDNKFISCAIDGKCLNIVSGDDDLLSVGNYGDVEILTVAEFLSRLDG